VIGIRILVRAFSIGFLNVGVSIVADIVGWYVSSYKEIKGLTNWDRP